MLWRLVDARFEHPFQPATSSLPSTAPAYPKSWNAVHHQPLHTCDLSRWRVACQSLIAAGQPRLASSLARHFVPKQRLARYDWNWAISIEGFGRRFLCPFWKVRPCWALTRAGTEVRRRGVPSTDVKRGARRYIRTFVLPIC